ncbi:MAG TPA: HepT-like ribonuclease domain-containing protein [Stellaceae bacterium]|jgi:uncharacterized protein with HEPN domain|nr:HepT-like ribonuclease domain-containing protein [Stellaceae bacterium]
MRRDPRALLWDAQRAAQAITEFTRGIGYTEFAGGLLLRSAVERQFEIIGEALAQLSKIAPEVAEELPNLRRIVAFRNILIHGYATIDREIVWRAVHESLPELQASLAALLGEMPEDAP